jgi:HAD superfamily hydrolase (TIGR01484 family)
MVEISLIAFDLDGTLAWSKQKVPPEIIEKLSQLLKLLPVCVISGGNFEQFDNNLLSQFQTNENFSNLHIMPTTGTQYFQFIENQWRQIYAHLISQQDAERIISLIENKARALGFWEVEVFGSRIENRGSQITFSALGQLASVELKEQWDPDGQKREILRDELANELTDFKVASGGSTSIDITIRGVDKAFGLSQLSLMTGLDIEGFVFVGDRLDPGGNDYPVKKLGIRTVETDGPKSSAKFLEGLILGLQAG